jgi:hypothetical protein
MPRRGGKKTKETLPNAGIDTSLEVRKRLEDVSDVAISRQSLGRLNVIIKQTMPSAKKGYAAKSVREDREGS